MRFGAILLFMLAYESAILAQIVDDFTDGELTSNPSWFGDTEDFIVTPDKVLQLNAAAAGTSLIYTSLALQDSAEWQFLYRMEFAPSESNKMRIYLMLDEDTVDSANGYFLEIGENGSTDALRFNRMDTGNVMQIAGSEGIFGGDPSTARIRITRDQNALWSVFTDLTGGENYTVLFSVNESTYPLTSSLIFGIECTYTDTRKDKFFFDDVFAGTPTPDTIAPMIMEVVVDDETHLTVKWNEALDPVSGLDPSRYSILPNIGTPVSVDFLDIEHQSIQLTLPVPLQTEITYTLHANEVRDVSGNVISTEAQFEYIRIARPDPYDILINEIMADPSPPLGLPNAEYLELYNRSDKTFQLEGYALMIGSQTVFLPEKLLPQDNYVVLVDKGDSTLFSEIPNVLPIDLPALTNSGTTIELTDDLGIALHRLSYDINSYQDVSRDDGGWSLELINPFAPCMITSHLRASLDLTGGTPGRLNSVTNIVADTVGPILQRVILLNALQMQCVFDEVISLEDLMVRLEPFHAITAITTEDNIVEITMQTPLQEGILYSLHMEQIRDCVGNISATQTQTFALPQAAKQGDLYINELLFDPETGGSRFIEVINVSNKFIDIGELIIADIQGDTIAAYPVETAFLCHPGAIVAITADPQDIRSRYFMHDPGQIISSTLPSFDRTSGNATVYTRAGVVLDAFDYQSDFHNALLDDAQGVSLERISPNLSTQARETWYSCAETAGFATPGLPNSQRLPDVTGEGIIEIEPEIFSPDGDGTDDFLTIRFPDVAPGVLATIRVFDAQGRNIARIANNVSLGHDALIRWDGVDESGARARIGPYVLWIELYGADGTVERYKRTCVLAERL